MSRSKSYRPDQRLWQWQKRGAKLELIDIICFYSATHCEMCNKKFNCETDRNLDHDHSTGLYRGALCTACNVGLARLGDQIDLALLKIKQYGKVLKHRKKRRIKKYA